MSPLAQGRGLKHDSGDLLVPSCFVAPRTGAWIETIAIDLCMTGDKTSPLAQGRGLKQSNQDRKSTRLNSSHIPLSRMPSSA